MADLISDFLDVLHKFAEAKGVRVTTVCNALAGQATLYHNLRAGKTITIDRYSDIMNKMAEQWPEGVKTPPPLTTWIKQRKLRHGTKKQRRTAEDEKLAGGDQGRGG